MLKLKLIDFMELAAGLNDMQSVLTFTEYHDADDPGRELTIDEKERLISLFEKASSLADKLQLRVSQAILSEKRNDIPKSRSDLTTIISLIRHEIGSEDFFHVERDKVSYYSNDTLLSEELKSSFPRASQELRHAANCIAVSEGTASVFHAMRAAEIGLRVLARDRGVEFPDKPLDMAEWQQLTAAIDKKIKDVEQLPRSHEKSENLEFYSQAAVQFRYFKDGWRVRAAHGYASYSDQQALTAYEHVRDFLLTLAPRLQEVGP